MTQQSLHERLAAWGKYAAKARSQKEFGELNSSDLTAMSDKDLAGWQSKYTPDSPQFLLANFEWQRRLTMQQIRAVRFAAWLSILGVVIGVVLGAVLAVWVNSHTAENSKKTNDRQSIPSSSGQEQGPEQPPVPPTANISIQNPTQQTSTKQQKTTAKQ